MANAITPDLDPVDPAEQATDDAAQKDQKEARFGEGDFGPDKADRLRKGVDVGKESPNVPEDVQKLGKAFSDTIHSTRAAVGKGLGMEGPSTMRTFNKEAFPKMPTGITSTTAFFDAVQEQAAQVWGQTMTDRLGTETQAWIAQLREMATANPDQAESINDMIKVLGNPAELEAKLRISQLGALEGLREVDLGLWEKLLAMSSERQQTEVRLAHRWVRDLTPDDLGQMGVTKEELQLVVRLNNFTKHFVDVGYLKQMEKAEQEGGSVAGALSSVTGGERLYETSPFLLNNQTTQHPLTTEKGAEAGAYKAMTYGEAFPLEMQRLSRNLDRVAETVDQWLSEGKLPGTYNGLSDHLRLMAQAYISPETRPAKLAELWDSVAQSGYDLASKGCPVVVIPPNTPAVASDANKIDIEARVALREPVEGLDDVFQGMAERVQDFNVSHADLLADEPVEPKIGFYRLFGAPGPNTFYKTPAEEAVIQGGVIWLHTNATSEVAKSDILPYLRGMLANEEIDEQEFVKGALLENGLHEYGHTRMTIADDAVAARIGEGDEKEVIEELKAETQGMRTFLEMFVAKGETVPPEMARRQMLAKLGVQFDAIANKTSDAGSFGERYHMPGLVIAKALLSSGVLQYDENADTYTITDYARGLEEVAKIGDMLAERFYCNSNCKPEDVKNFVEADVRPLSNDLEIKKLKDKLRNAR